MSNNDNKYEEDNIINLLYLFSYFLEFTESSKNILDNNFKEIKKPSENFELEFRNKNEKNDKNFDLDELLLLSPNEPSKTKDDNKQIKIKKIFKVMGLDIKSKLMNNLKGEEIFNIINNNITKLIQIISTPFLIQFLSEKLNKFIMAYNNIFYSILKMKEKKAENLLSELNKERGEKEQIMSENTTLKSKIDELTRLIAKNSEEIRILKEDTEEKNRILENKIEENKNETSLELKKVKNETSLEFKKVEIKFEENKNESDVKHKTIENKINKNKNEAALEIKKVEVKLEEENMKLRQEIQLLRTLYTQNKKDYEKKFRNLGDKYYKYIRADLDNFVLNENIQKKFDSYSNEICELNQKVNELVIANKKLIIELDKKDAEINKLKLYAKALDTVIDFDNLEI
jgi:hypothetical protein